MSQHDPPDDWHARPVEDCCDDLDTGVDGLGVVLAVGTPLLALVALLVRRFEADR